MNALVVVPTYNERENLPILIEALVARNQCRVMVVDDSSSDGTGQIADALAATYPGWVDVVHRQGQRGLGVSYREGLARAVKTSVDIVCQMDADLSHDPEQLADLVTATGSHDLVIGSRYHPGWKDRELATATGAPELPGEPLHPAGDRTLRPGLHERLPSLATLRAGARTTRGLSFGRLRVSG